MDPTLIVTLVGFATLITERLFSWMMKINKSDCCGCVKIERSEEQRLLSN